MQVKLSAMMNGAAAIGKALGKAGPLAVFLSGLLFCVAAVTLPELLPAIVGKEGYVWSPLHSQNYRLGDLYYYGAWLREVLQGGIPAYSPSAGELAGQPLIETWRFMGLVVAALPGLFISDIRALIVFDYGLSAALFFCAAFLFAYSFTRNAWIGLLAGIAVLFLTDRVWCPVRPNVQRLTDVWTIVASAFNRVVEYIRYTRNFIEYDLYGSTFRFINISISGPILLLYYCLAALAYKHAGYKTFAMLFAVSPLMAFTYPSHTIIAYGLLAAFFLVCLCRRKWKAAAAFFSAGVLTIIFLEVIRYRKMISELFDKSELWNNIFASEKFVLLNSDASYILAMMLFNKYTITFLMMIFLARKKQLLRDIVAATGMVVIPMSGVYMFNMSQLWTRFLGRGVDHMWFMLCIVVAGDAVRSALSGTAREKAPGNAAPGLHRRILSASAATVMLVVMVLVAVGSINFALHTRANGSRFIPQATMDAYRWIDAHLPARAEVATLDWTDITLLPVFTSVNLVVGHSIIDGRSPTEELKRYIGAWKFFGYDKPRFEQMIDLGTSSVIRMRQVESIMNPPRLPDREFEASQFMLGILYWPHINSISGIKIAGEGKDRVITPEFRRFMMDLYDRTEASSFVGKYRAQYATMSSEQEAMLGIPRGTRILYRTKTRAILAFER